MAPDTNTTIRQATSPASQAQDQAVPVSGTVSFSAPRGVFKQALAAARRYATRAENVIVLLGPVDEMDSRLALAAGLALRDNLGSACVALPGTQLEGGTEEAEGDKEGEALLRRLKAWCPADTWPFIGFSLPADLTDRVIGLAERVRLTAAVSFMGDDHSDAFQKTGVFPAHQISYLTPNASGQLAALPIYDASGDAANYPVAAQAHTLKAFLAPSARSDASPPSPTKEDLEAGALLWGAMQAIRACGGSSKTTEPPLYLMPALPQTQGAKAAPGGTKIDVSGGSTAAAGRLQVPGSHLVRFKDFDKDKELLAEREPVTVSCHDLEPFKALLTGAEVTITSDQASFLGWLDLGASAGLGPSSVARFQARVSWANAATSFVPAPDQVVFVDKAYQGGQRKASVAVTASALRQAYKNVLAGAPLDAPITFIFGPDKGRLHLEARTPLGVATSRVETFELPPLPSSSSLAREGVEEGKGPGQESSASSPSPTVKFKMANTMCQALIAAISAAGITPSLTEPEGEGKKGKEKDKEKGMEEVPAVLDILESTAARGVSTVLCASYSPGAGAKAGTGTEGGLEGRMYFSPFIEARGGV